MTATIDLPPAIRRLLEASGKNPRIHGLYDELGGAVYRDLADADASEIEEILGALDGVESVLELAAGSGRITLPLVRSGRRVAALELSGAMIELLKENLRASGLECRIHQGDMAAFELPDLFDAVVIGTTSLSLLNGEDRRAALQCSFQHLIPGGRIVLTAVDRGPSSKEDFAIKVTGGSGREYGLAESWPAGADSRRVAMFAVDDARSDAADIDVFVTDIRVMPVALLTSELAAASFTDVHVVELSADHARHRTWLLTAERPA